MYARVSTLAVPPERTKEARRQITEEAVPAARDLPGLKKAFWLSDAASATVVAVVVYESEADLVGNREASNAIRKGSVESIGGSVRSVEEFEVIAEI